MNDHGEDSHSPLKTRGRSHQDGEKGHVDLFNKFTNSDLRQHVSTPPPP